MGAKLIFAPDLERYSGDPTLPLLTLVRRYMQWTDWLILLCTQRCRYNCSFCSLPTRSPIVSPVDDEILQQCQNAASACNAWLTVVDSLSIGNEGSVFDEDTLHASTLESVILSAARRCPRLRRIALETRPEFARPATLSRLAAEVSPARLDVTMGLETLDEELRSNVLGKPLSLGLMERALEAAAECECAATVYVVAKPDPAMNEAAAVEEAVRTCRWVMQRARSAGVQLTIRLNPLYVPNYSPLLERLQAGKGSPPSLCLLVRILERAYEPTVGWFLGLDTEGLASRLNTYKGAVPYSQDAVRALAEFNATQDTGWIAVAKALLQCDDR